MTAKFYYDKLRMESAKNPVTYTFDDIPAKHRPKVKAMADADLASGKLPRWQYDKMFGEGV